jgi:hypothetical protein
MHHRYPCFPILELQLLLFFTLAICDYLLEPIKSFSKVLNVGDTETFLVDESIGKRIKDMAIFFATIIPVAVAVIQLLLPK